MRTYLFVLLLLPFQLISQQNNYRLSNGVEFKGTLHRITEDSIFILTGQGELVAFSLKQITQTHDTNPLTIKESNPLSEKKYVFQTGLGLGFGLTEGGFLHTGGLEAKLLYKFLKYKNQYIICKTGFEALAAFFPVTIIPVTGGYQFTLIKSKIQQIHMFGNAGWGFSNVENPNEPWESRSSKGGARFETGFTWFPKVNNNASFYFGSTLLFQNVSFTSRSDWNNSQTKQQLRRILFNFGVMF